LIHYQVHDPSEWDSLLLKYVVPKLAATLREDFKVNPAQQDIKPLQDVLAWAEIIRPSIFSQLLETELFPKWLITLHQWLVHPEASFEEVAQWYSSWKRIFSEDVQRMSGVERGFTKGLELMNKAIELGPAVSQLPRPDVQAPGVPAGQTKARTTVKAKPSRTQEITFRSIVDDYASSHNLMFFPAGKVDEKTGHALFRVSQGANGKGGLLVYIADDAVWALDGDQYRAIPLEEMVLRATKA
jgi:tuftelin-interacting protein 11